MNRVVRGLTVALGTIVFFALGLLYPALARGEAWLTSVWTVPVLAWLPREARFPVLAAVILVVCSLVVWRMTLAADTRTPRLRISSVAPLLTGPRGLRTRLRDMPGMLRGACLALCLLALGRPQNVLRGENTDERGIDIVIVLDLSGSMKALMDADESGARSQGGQIRRLTRLDTAKEVILDFVSRRKNDRIGVVVFGRTAYILSPPTLDKSLLSTLVSKMDLGLIDGNGTAIGDAVGTAVARLRRSNARSKAVILLTDGDSNAGSIAPDYAAHLAQTQAVKVYTVQIGDGDDVEVQDGVDLFGQPRFVRQHFPVNPELLKRMASSTGGDSFVATDKKGLTRSMHSILDKLEKTRFEAQAATMEDLFPFFVVPAVMLLAIEALVRIFLVRRFP
ncbi:BatA (aerotolerance operon) [Labilithrix luteola]|uniref:BatA (Aerotolerance operon) n=1 Tax=Labilithrix luteola TaxID=1391654 RepID=A0A0K1QEM2_9BACT|nr:VWA domain-containing protein [Labilithrix luteola]AKV03875.1 BatA (aerotolerance operon) [Labilithrix luteola]